MRVDFTKMHGLGNDFIVFEAAASAPQLAPEQWRQLADRHRGIGFDQGLVIEPPRRAGTAAFYRIFNADGIEVEQCGNGARCIAELLRMNGRAPTGSVQMESPGGLVNARLPGNGIVAVDMGVPDFSPAASGFEPQGGTQINGADPAGTWQLQVDGQAVRFGVVSMGNPHAVIRVAAVQSAPVAHLGPLLERHAAFTRRVNVGFMQVLTRDHIRLRVFERGVGETQACGTGACAAMAVGRRDGLLDAEVTVTLPGGDLVVRWEREGEPLWLEGPATVSFRGQFEI